MAKRKIRDTNPQHTNEPAPQRRSATDGQSATEGPAGRPARARRKTDSAKDAAAAATETRKAGLTPDAPIAAPVDTAATTRTVVVEVEPERVAVPHEHIAVRAYHIYLERGGRAGDDFEDWIRAERELRARAGAHQLR